MRRIAPIALLLLAVLPGVASAAPAAPASVVATGLDQCQAGSASQNGSATFRGEMRSVPGSDRMSIRFDLYARAPGEDRFTRSAAPSAWIKSLPGTARFIWHKRFEELTGPADYRVVVRFRWYDASGALLARARRTTAACSQPDLRPNLTLGAPTVLADPQPGLRRYAIPVLNAGRGDAGPFDVALWIGAAPEPSLVAVSALAAADVQTVTFVAPPCAPGDTLRFEADPGVRVAEADERDNVLRVVCPGV